MQRWLELMSSWLLSYCFLYYAGSIRSIYSRYWVLSWCFCLTALELKIDLLCNVEVECWVDLSFHGLERLPNCSPLIKQRGNASKERILTYAKKSAASRQQPQIFFCPLHCHLKAATKNAHCHCEEVPVNQDQKQKHARSNNDAKPRWSNQTKRYDKSLKEQVYLIDQCLFNAYQQWCHSHAYLINFIIYPSPPTTTFTTRNATSASSAQVQQHLPPSLPSMNHIHLILWHLLKWIVQVSHFDRIRTTRVV